MRFCCSYCRLLGRMFTLSSIRKKFSNRKKDEKALFSWQHRETRGSFYAIMAALTYSLMMLSVKLTGPVSEGAIVFFRNVICLLFLLFVIIHKKVSLRSTQGPLLFQRSLAGLIALYASFYAAKKMLLVDAVLLVNTAPLFMPLIVWVWFKTKIMPWRLIAISMGFFGVFFILKPDKNMLQIAGIIGLSSGFFLALAYVTVRKLSATEPPERIMFYFFLPALIFSFFFMVLTWEPIVEVKYWLLMALIGVFSFLFQYLMTLAYSYVAPTKAGALIYLATIFSGVWEWLIWRRLPDMWSLIGIVLVISGSIIALSDRSPSKGE